MKKKQSGIKSRRHFLLSVLFSLSLLFLSASFSYAEVVLTDEEAREMMEEMEASETELQGVKQELEELKNISEEQKKYYEEQLKEEKKKRILPWTLTGTASAGCVFLSVLLILVLI